MDLGTVVVPFDFHFPPVKYIVTPLAGIQSQVSPTTARCQEIDALDHLAMGPAVYSGPYFWPDFNSLDWARQFNNGHLRTRYSNGRNFGTKVTLTWGGRVNCKVNLFSIRHHSCNRWIMIRTCVRLFLLSVLRWISLDYDPYFLLSNKGSRWLLNSLSIKY